MKPSIGPQEPLTQVEYKKFQHFRKRVIFSGIAAFSFAGVMGINQKFLHLEPNPFVIFVCVGLITIWGLIQMFKYKCPRCGTTPMMTRPSFGGGEVAVGSFIALRPIKCLKCGVSFSPPQQAADETA